MKKLLLTTVFAAISSISAFAQGQPVVTDAERLKIESVLKQYILKNPEIVQEALQALDIKQAMQEEKARSEVLLKNKDALYRPTNNLIFGNAKGDVTLVEFFDYNCGFCKRGFTDVQNMMKGDKQVRVIFRDFPVLGQGSMEAARVAVAVKMQGNNEKFMAFHEKLLLGRGAANHDKAIEAATDAGLDMVRLKKDLADGPITQTIQENLKIGDALKITGTPSYVIGEDVVIGAVGLETLQRKAADYRKACANDKTKCI